MAHDITVIGAVNVDISGTPVNPLIDHDSNIGKIRISYGGVGRNIAENLCRLGVKTEMITVLGDDLYAKGVREHASTIGLGLTHALEVPGGTTSTYLCINDERGDMHIAVNDMEILDHLTQEYLASKLDVMAQGKYVILDANLSAETINYIAKHCPVPILADPVSVNKGQRIIPAMHCFHTMKPNLIEAEVMSGVPIRTDEDLKKAAHVFLNKGMTNVFISLGSRGVYYCSRNEEGLLPCYPTNLVNATGGGDTLMAAIAKGLLDNKSLHETAQLGLAAAAICVQSPLTCSPELSMKKINQIIGGK